MATTLKIGVDQLKIGMYVAQLDRPWLETPFLFQGFYIRDQDEIRELQEHCEYVYILHEDTPGAPDLGLKGRAQAKEEQPWGRATKRPRRRGFLRGIFRIGDRKEDENGPETRDSYGYPKPGSYHEETETFETELRTATTIHKDAVITVREVMESLKASEKLDVQRLEAVVTPMVSSILRNAAALSCLVRLQRKDDYLYNHSLASLVWATILGRHIGLDQQDLNVLAMGALLLDIGKTRLPDTILRKSDPLKEDEKALVRQHVEFGLDILSEAQDVDQRVRDMVAHHHERYNGTGYPAGLTGSQVPVFGRIAGIVDTYDAMITPRPYAKPMSSYEAFRQLRELADVEFQTELIDQFIQAIGVFPTGTLVELNTGEVGIVTKQNRVRGLRPEIMVIMNAEKNIMESFSVVDLIEESIAEDGHQSVWIERGLAPGSFGIDPTEFFLD